MQAQNQIEPVSVTPTILDRSPFLPPGWSPPRTSRRPTPEAKKPETTGYEFRGVYQLGGQYRFLISKPKSRNGDWVEMGKAYEDYEVRDYNPDTATLVLFYNDKEEPVKLADLEANPTPIPVSGQSGTVQKARDDESRPVRRTIRPATRGTEDGSRERPSAPPPPAWLQKLREEAAARRAQASGGGSPQSGSPGGLDASGNPGGQPTSQPDSDPPAGPPPELPAALKDFVPDPPPLGFPPTPPPDHVLEQMLQKIGNPPGN